MKRQARDAPSATKCPELSLTAARRVADLQAPPFLGIQEDQQDRGCFSASLPWRATFRTVTRAGQSRTLAKDTPRARRGGNLRAVVLDEDRVAALAARSVASLTRRDLARALLSVPSTEALAAVPELRRQLFAAGNPLSAAFWESAETVLGSIVAGAATIGDVRHWLESTGTEPTGLIGMHVWEDEGKRSELQAEMHGLLVAHLEDRLAAGEIEPDLLVTGDFLARRAYVGTQERWMTSPLPDGRVPMDVLLDEQDEQFLADWDEAEAEALSELRMVVDEVGERPLPGQELREACVSLRSALARPGWPGNLLAACGDVDPRDLPADDTELWLRLAAGIASPAGELPDDDKVPDPDDELDEDSQAIVALCTLQPYDWLAAVATLARRGPGTAAAAYDLARYVSEFEPDDDDRAAADDADEGDDSADSEFGFDEFDEDFDESEDQEAGEGFFFHVTGLWQALGALDDAERLTPLGWWGLPEALQRAWTPRG